MDNKVFEQFGVFGKNFTDSAKELEAINTKILEKISQKQMDLMNSAVETSSKFAGLVGETKDYQELVGEQTKIATEYSEKLVTAARETFEILAESQKEYQAWFEAGVKTASESAANIVPMTPPAPTKKGSKAA